MLIVSAILLEASAVEVGVYFLAEWSGMGLEDPVAANGLKTNRSVFFGRTVFVIVHTVLSQS